MSMVPQPLELVNQVQRTLGEGGTKLFDTLPYMLRTLIEEKAWENCADKSGQPFPSFEAFVTHKLWWGLESSIDDLLAYSRNYPDVQALIRGAVGEMPRKGTSDIVTSKARGNEATYALRRLKRDNPELAEAVVRGELSANAAAIKAGFRKATWTAPADPELLAQKIPQKFPGWVMTRVA